MRRETAESQRQHISRMQTPSQLESPQSFLHSLCPLMSLSFFLGQLNYALALNEFGSIALLQLVKCCGILLIR